MMGRLFLLFILCFSFGAVADNSLPKELTFSYIENDERQLTAASVITTVYARLGIKINLLALPAKRSLFQSGTGQVDGEILRILKVQQIYPDLLAVPVNIFELNGMAYTIDGSKEFVNVKDILSSRIAIHRGIVWQETFIEKGLGLYTRVNATARLVRLLVTNRVDYVLIEQTRGSKLLNAPVEGHQIVEVSPAIIQTSSFHFSHRKHQALVPLVTKQLEQMKASGELAELWKLHADSR